MKTSTAAERALADQARESDAAWTRSEQARATAFAQLQRLGGQLRQVVEPELTLLGERTFTNVLIRSDVTDHYVFLIVNARPFVSLSAIVDQMAPVPHLAVQRQVGDGEWATIPVPDGMEPDAALLLALARAVPSKEELLARVQGRQQSAA